LVGVAGLLALATIFYLSGLRIWRSGQFPAPGTSVLFTTRVFTGWWAQANAVTMFLLAGFSAVGLGVLAKFFVFSDFGVYVLGLRSCGA
jgi:hypothetical protein